MSALNDFILSGITQVENTLGNPVFTWNGEDFACIPNTINDSIKSVSVGFDTDADFRMTVKLSQFTPNIYPELNDYITYLGYRMLIRTIKKPAHGVYWVYVCELPGIGH